MKEIGELSELRFLAKAYSEGFVVSKPFGDNASYDFIVDHNGKLSRVQCKSTATLDKRNAYKICTTHGKNKQILYLSEDIDVIACYVFPTDSWYIIPIDRVSTKTINLYPHRISERPLFEGFLEAWGLFEDKSDSIPE